METRALSESEDDRIVHVREALMCPDGGGVPTLRTARFLNHTITAIDDDVFELPFDAFSSRPETFEPEKWPVKFSFVGWGSPSLNWVEWVNAMAESHAHTWRKSGVHDAIMGSRYEVKKHEGLVMALVEKWCVDTNTFIFPWGEGTITLEDMMVLGGFSAIGNYVLGSIKREEAKSVEEKLKRAKKEIEINLGKKCCVNTWMKKFINSGSEIEHEAFIVTWLSRFVFPNSAEIVPDKLFPAAVQLARGVRLALAPAVLAGIYRDLGLLKERLAGYVNFGHVEEEKLLLTSPFQFVQVWALERIMEVRASPAATPTLLKPNEPRLARWHHHHKGQEYSKVENFRSILDSARDSFDYRPYTKALKNFKYPKFYLENDCWVSVDSSMDEDIVSFARCLRFSKLVGLDCIEPYYPHRVAMQFGYDQDLPGIVPARIETPELAWKDYIRPICDGMLYVPSRLYEADVTYRYTEWWRESVSVLQSLRKRSMNLSSPQKEKPALTNTDSPGRLKTMSVKVNEKKGEEMVKRVTEAKEGKLFANSRIAVKRMKAAGENGGGVSGSEQAQKQLKGTNKGGSLCGSSKVLSKKSPVSTKSSPERSKNDEKTLKGALKDSRETKGNNDNHVRFLLPNSPVRSLNTQPVTPKQTSKDSPVRTSKPLHRPAERKREDKGHSVQSGIALRDSRKRPVLGSGKRKNDSKNATAGHDSTNSGITTTKPRGLKETDESHFPPGFDSRNFPQVDKNPSGKSPDSGGVDAEASKPLTEESLKDVQVATETNALNLLDQMVVIKEQVGEGGEVMYQIPKSQFEILNQGFQGVLKELQTIKSALNISK